MPVGDRPRPNASITHTFSIQDGQVYRGSPPPRKSSKPEPQHGSGKSFGMVWVNDLGRPAMASDQAATFPVGSILVREKRAKADDVKPELLAVMIKRPAGFSPSTNNWEYLVIDGAMTKVRNRQTTGSCHDCHSQKRDRDFVFPIALPK